MGVGLGTRQPFGARLGRKLQTARLLFRLGGARAVLVHAGAKLGYRQVTIYRLDLGQPPAPVEPRIDVTFGWLSEAELDAPAEHLQNLGHDVIETYLRNGDRCWVARRGDRIGASRWVTIGPALVHSLGIRYELPPGCAYIHDSFTSEELRGQRVGPAAATRLAALLARDGCRSLIGFVQAGDLWAVRNAEHSGYGRAGRLVKLELGPVCLPVYRTRGIQARFER